MKAILKNILREAVSLKATLHFLFGLTLLLMLPGCAPWQMVKEKLGIADKADKNIEKIVTQTSMKEVGSDQNTVLLSIDGKTVLQKDEFEDCLIQIVNANEFFKSIGVKNFPAELKRKIFDKIVQNKLIVYKANQMGIASQEEFKKSYDDTIKLLKESLLVKFYEKDLIEGITITDQEVRQDYDQNREQYIKVAGGVRLQSAQFTDKIAADNFLEKVKKDMGNFKSFAQADEKAKFQDFELVRQDVGGAMHSLVPAHIRQEAFKNEKDEDVVFTTQGNDYWVLHMFDRAKTELFSFDEIKTQLEAKVRNAKFAQELEKNLKNLEGEFTINVNDKYFAEAKKVVQLPIDKLPIKKVEEKSLQT